MMKFVVFFLICIISTARCEENEVFNGKIDDFLQEDVSDLSNEDKSLQNFVYLWKELQTSEGIQFLSGILRNNATIESYCLKAWEVVTKIEFLPKEEFTAQNKNRMLNLCKGELTD